MADDSINLGDVSAGVSIWDAAMHALAMLEVARRCFPESPIHATFVFNGTETDAWLGETPEYVVGRYQALRKFSELRRVASPPSS